MKPPEPPVALRPLHRGETTGAWVSHDGAWTFLRAEEDPSPRRWFAYRGSDDFPANPGEGHTTLRAAVAWASRQPNDPAHSREVES